MPALVFAKEKELSLVENSTFCQFSYFLSDLTFTVQDLGGVSSGIMAGYLQIKEDYDRNISNFATADRASYATSCAHMTY